jgi:O-antigen/teichoic acid export membrane protein
MSLLKHASNYSIGSLLVTLASLVSFPIFTRLLDIDEYGLMTLVMSTIGFLVAFGKLGMQHATLRFYAEINAEKSNWNHSQYYTTVIFSILTIGSIVVILWLITINLLQSFSLDIFKDERLLFLFNLTAILILIRIASSIFVNILRARERSGILIIYNVAKRYSVLILSVGGMLYIVSNISIVFYAHIIAESIMMIFLMIFVVKTMEQNSKVTTSAYSNTLFKSMMFYGMPMLGFELAGRILNIGDRYVIESYLGNSELGAYAAAYAVCEIVNNIIVSALAMAVLPMYLRIWSKQGEVATKTFIKKSLYYYLMIGFPVIAGLSAVGSDMLALLASDKYLSGVSIIPYVITGMVMNGAFAMFGAGLYIYKQSNIIMLTVASFAIINIVINIILVPKLGFDGAAIATLISYLGLSLVIYHLAKKHMSIELPRKEIIIFVLSSIIMYLVVIEIHFANMYITLITQIIVGILVYTTLLLILDKQARILILEFSQRIKGFLKI